MATHECIVDLKSAQELRVVQKTKNNKYKSGAPRNKSIMIQVNLKVMFSFSKTILDGELTVNMVRQA